MVNVQITNSNHSWKIGLLKTLKNIAVTYGVPALVLFLNSYNEWVPIEYAAIAAPIMGGITYALKNYIENK